MTISSEPASKSCLDYTVWNSTLTVGTHSCPSEGCDGAVLSDTSSAHFAWSYNATWRALNASVPCSHAPGSAHANKLCSHEAPVRLR